MGPRSRCRPRVASRRIHTSSRAFSGAAADGAGAPGRGRGRTDPLLTSRRAQPHALAAADPVVTSNVDRLGFESFSGCAGVYARLDLEPELLGGEAAAWGTTNVDFNLPMRAALARVHDADAMLMHVGHDQVRVTTLAGSEVERKVPLPERWVKGFAEVQVSASRMLLTPRARPCGGASLPPEPAADPARASRLGDACPGHAPPDHPARRRCGVHRGPERLRLLEKLLPFARSLRVYGPLPTSPRVAEPSAWELVLNGGRVVFVISPELFRGFSGEGGVLSALAAADDAAVEAVAELLHGEPSIDSAAVAETSRFDRTTVETALGALGAAGRVGYDLSAGSFFHRELPYDRAFLDSMHPRLLGARELVDAGAVRLDGAAATVASGDVEYVVRFDDDGARCTCAWFARHRGSAVRCKHVLAAEQVRRSRARHVKDALLAAVKRGDVPGVRDLIVGATEKERRAAAPAVNDSSSRPFTKDVGAWRASGLARVGINRPPGRRGMVVAVPAAARGRRRRVPPARRRRDRCARADVRLDRRPRNRRRRPVRQLAARASPGGVRCRRSSGRRRLHAVDGGRDRRREGLPTARVCVRRASSRPGAARRRAVADLRSGGRRRARERPGVVLQGGKRPDERLRAAREPLDVCARPGRSRQPAPPHPAPRRLARRALS